MQFARKVQEPGRSRNLSCLMLRRAKATEDRWRHCFQCPLIPPYEELPPPRTVYIARCDHLTPSQWGTTAVAILDGELLNEKDEQETCYGGAFSIPSLLRRLILYSNIAPRDVSNKRLGWVHRCTCQYEVGHEASSCREHPVCKRERGLLALYWSIALPCFTLVFHDNASLHVHSIHNFIYPQYIYTNISSMKYILVHIYSY